MKLLLIFLVLGLPATVMAQAQSTRLRDSAFNQLNSGSPPNGSERNCTNCTQTLPCAAGGTGAVAHKIAGVWSCTAGSAAGGGSGNVVGPSASSVGELATYNLTTGKSIGRNNTLNGYVKVASGFVSAAVIPVADLPSMTSAQFLALVTDETGTGLVVGNNTPTFITPVLGAAIGTSLNLSGAETVGGLFNGCADAGGSDSYACSLSPAPSGYTTGQVFWFKANTANTGVSTVNFNSLGVKTIKKVAGGITTDLADNDIRAGQYVNVLYDGTNMQMISLLGNVPGGTGTVTVVGAGNLTSTALVTGGGTQTVQTPSATATMDSSGNISTPGSVTTGLVGGANGKSTYSGLTSGSAAISVAAVAGTPSDINLPIATGGASTLLESDGGTPQQTSWRATSGTGSVARVDSPVFTTQITSPKNVYTGSVFDSSGSGSPEGVVTAAIGSTYRRTNGGASTTLYVKESGAGNTGWIAYGAGGGAAFDPLDPTVEYVREGFIGGNQSSGSIGELGWTVVNNAGSLTGSIIEGTYPRFGQIQMDTSTSSGDGGTMLLSSINGVLNKLGNLGGNTNWDSSWIVSLNQTTLERVRFGMCFQGGANLPTDGLWIGFDTTSGDTNFTAETRAASTSTRTSLGVAVDTSFHRFRIRSTVAGTVKFSIDGGAETSIATNVPTANLSPCMIVATATTAARSAKADFFAFTMTGLSR